MAVNGIELAVGQVWRTRNGMSLAVVSRGKGAWPWLMSNSAILNDDGCYGPEGESFPYDLIELIRDEHGFTIWRGGEQPAETKNCAVHIRFSNGGYSVEPADEVRWDHKFGGQQDDIASYKILRTSVATTDAAALAAETLSALGWRFDGQAWVQDVPKSLPRGEALTEFVSTLGRGESAGTSALDVQIGGSHYKSLAIQPMEYSMANKLDACQHTIIKYVSRFRDKGGIDDLKKARHTIDMLIEFEGKQS